MKRFFASLLMALGVSCKPAVEPTKPENGLRTHGTVTDESGNDRLRLVFKERAEAGADFDSLVWERRIKRSWEEYLRITESQFEADTDRGRWPSKIHSFDASSGTAVILVSEGDAPRDSAEIGYVYSWRRWDLTTNSEEEFFYACKPEELFDPFDPKRSEQDGDEPHLEGSPGIEIRPEKRPSSM